jgi:hypothetical protein
MLRVGLRNSLVALALVAVAVAAPRDASADASQLCRSFTTIVLAPTDLIAAPYIAGADIYTGLQDQSDSNFSRAVAIVPGYALLLYMQAAGSILRVVAGVFEFIPGLITLPQETSPKALFTSQDEAEAMFSEDYGPCPVRMGVHYNTIPWG